MANYDYKAYKARYTARHRSYMVNLDKVEDKAVIDWLEGKSSKARAIREILKREIEKECHKTK